MHRLLRALGIVATVSLVAYAALLLFADGEADEAVEDAIADARSGDEDKDEADRRRERFNVVARGMAMSPNGPDGAAQSDDLPVDASVPKPAIEYGSGELTVEDVRKSFDYAMARVDAVADSRQRITREDWDKLYREANDAYSALSIVLDARDEAQAAELEAAYKQLKSSLKRVRVRGRKFAD